MPKLKYEPKSFGKYWGIRLTHPSFINFTWEELCKSAITVGRRNWQDVFLYGDYSAFEILWRFNMLQANLVEDGAGYLRPSKAFCALDPSEKGAVSFFLGMCFTKLIVEKLFGVPWLLHLDVYNSILDPKLAFKLRPDFVGLDENQQWIVVESKGRSWSLPNQTMEKAKHQTRSLRKINMELPVLRVAIGSFFSSSGLNARVWDPEEYDTDAKDIKIDPEQLIRAYYRPIVEYIKLQSFLPSLATYDQADMQRRGRLNLLDAAVSIDDDILAWYDSDYNFWKSIVLPKMNNRDSVLTEVAAYKRDIMRMAESAATEVFEPPKTIDIVEQPERHYERQPRSDKFVQDQEKANLKRQENIKELIEQQRTSNIVESIDGVKIALGKSWSPEYMRRQPQNRKD